MQASPWFFKSPGAIDHFTSKRDSPAPQKGPTHLFPREVIYIFIDMKQVPIYRGHGYPELQGQHIYHGAIMEGGPCLSDAAAN
jgi:hypothetical protein